MSISPAASAAEHARALGALVAAGQQRDAQAGRLGQRRDALEMLAGEDLGRRHQRGLPPGFDDARHGQQRDHGLARADIALEQAQHALSAREVGADLATACSCAPVRAKGRAASIRRDEPSVAGIARRPGCRRMRARTSASASWEASSSS